MGPAQPTSNPGSSKLEQHYLQTRLGQGRNLMRNKQTRQPVVTLERTFPSEQLLNQHVRKNRGLMALQHPFYLNAHDYQILSQANLCSKQFKIVEFYPYQPHTIQEEIARRGQEGRGFTNKEVMSILCSAVLALSHISKLELVHTTLNPDDIIIDDQGVCKVISSNLSNHQFTFEQDPSFYYAPETLKIFKMQSANNTLTNKSGVFTLGVTLLSMVHLTPLHHLYQLNSHCIRIEELNQLLDSVMDNDLQVVLRKMLKFHSYERITFTELEQMLYEIISQQEMQGQKSTTCLRKSYQKVQQVQQEQQQINKLRQSILRIRQSPHEDITMSNISHKELPPHFFSQPPQSLPADQEDPPQFDLPYHPVTQQDSQVLDEDDSHKDLPYYHTSRRGPSVSDSEIEARVDTYFMPSENHRHQYSNSQADSRASEDFLLLKENQGPCQSLKPQKSQKDVLPEYVTEFFQQGKYQGYKVGKHRQGFGTFYYNQGGKYCGEWSKNRMQGKGVLYYASGKLAYEGEWHQDRLNGYGVLYNENISSFEGGFNCKHLEDLKNEWIKYQGYFRDDQKQGQGTLFLANGQFFRGRFEKDLPHGEGQFRNLRGEVRKGFWLMGALNQLDSSIRA